MISFAPDRQIVEIQLFFFLERFPTVPTPVASGFRDWGVIDLANHGSDVMRDARNTVIDDSMPVPEVLDLGMMECQNILCYV